MAKTTLFKGVVYLSQEQYNKLIALGAIEVDGNVIQYDDSIVYVTPQALPDDYYTKEQTKELIKNQVVSGDEFIVVDEGEPGTINEGKIVVELDKTNIETETATENSEKLITSGAVFNSLSASGGGKLYRHIIKLNRGASIEIINNSAEIFTELSLSNYLNANGYVNSSHPFPIYTGTPFFDIGMNFPINIFKYGNDLYLNTMRITIISTLQDNNITNTYNFSQLNQIITTVIDTVIEL